MSNNKDQEQARIVRLWLVPGLKSNLELINKKIGEQAAPHEIIAAFTTVYIVLKESQAILPSQSKVAFNSALEDFADALEEFSKTTAMDLTTNCAFLKQLASMGRPLDVVFDFAARTLDSIRAPIDSESPAWNATIEADFRKMEQATDRLYRCVGVRD